MASSPMANRWGKGGSSNRSSSYSLKITADGDCSHVFKLWCWRRLLRVYWKPRKSNQSILNDINTEYSLKGLMLKLQYLGHLMQTSQVIGKDPDAGKDWKQEEKGMTEDETAGWHLQFNGHELGQTPGDVKRQGSLTCYSPWSHKESEKTWKLDNKWPKLELCLGIKQKCSWPLYLSSLLPSGPWIS